MYAYGKLFLTFRNLALSEEILRRKLMSSNSTYWVFLYGTLKYGEPNHNFLMDSENGSASFISKGRTLKKWPLVIASQYNIPFLLYLQDHGKHVIGEIYEVNEKMLKFLDEFENHPTFYERIMEDVELIDKDQNLTKSCKIWIYFLKNFRPALVDLPYLEDYSSTGNHGLLYVERYKRNSQISYHKDVMNVE